MTSRQEKLIENYVRSKVKKMLKESNHDNVQQFTETMVEIDSLLKLLNRNPIVLEEPELKNACAILYKSFLKVDKINKEIVGV